MLADLGVWIHAGLIPVFNVDREGASGQVLDMATSGLPIGQVKYINITRKRKGTHGLDKPSQWLEVTLGEVNTADGLTRRLGGSEICYSVD
jgi:hypothetical protein